MPHTASRPAPARPMPGDVLIEHALLGLAALAVVALISLPAARSASDTFGWLPFWLLALPLCAWATARLLRLRAGRANGHENGHAGRRASASVHVLAVRTRTPDGTARTLPRAA